jgi:hypothetical protein
MALKIRFDQAAPYEVEEADVPFARPEGKELLARVYKPKGETDVPIAALVDVHGGAWSRGDRLTGWSRSISARAPRPSIRPRALTSPRA